MKFNRIVAGTIPSEFTRWKGPRPAMTRHQQLQRRLGVFDATSIGLGSMLGAGVFVVFGPGCRPGRKSAPRIHRDRRGGGVLQRRGVGRARGHVPGERRHLHLRPPAAGRMARLPGRLGFRDRQDGLLRRHGPDLRAVRGAGLRHPGGRRGRGGADRREPDGHHPDGVPDPHPAGRRPGHAGVCGRGQYPRPAPCRQRDRANPWAVLGASCRPRAWCSSLSPAMHGSQPLARK